MSCIMNPGFWTYLIVLIGGIMIIRIVFPWIISFFEFPDPIGRILMIVLWVVIACAGVIFMFALFSCFGGVSMPIFPSHR